MRRSGLLHGEAISINLAALSQLLVFLGCHSLKILRLPADDVENCCNSLMHMLPWPQLRPGHNLVWQLSLLTLVLSLLSPKEWPFNPEPLLYQLLQLGIEECTSILQLAHQSHQSPRCLPCLLSPPQQCLQLPADNLFLEVAKIMSRY